MGEDRDNKRILSAYVGEDTARDAVVRPQIPRAMLAMILEIANRNDAVRQIGEAVFDQTNHGLMVQLSEIATVESESFEAQAAYDTLVDERRKVDHVRKYVKQHPERQPTRIQKLTHFGLFVCFLGALAFVSGATANFVIDANLYPALENNLWMALLTAGIAVTVFIGGPICVYALKETDEDRRRFARHMAWMGLSLGCAWLLLFASVDALDNYILVTLTRHRFHGDWAFLNGLLPTIEDIAKFLMVITQILGEASGAVAIELRAMRIKEVFQTIEVEPNPYFVNLEQRIRAAQAVAVDFAGQLAHLKEQQALLDKMRAVFITLCGAWLETFEKDHSISAAVGRRKFINDKLGE